MPRSKYCTSAIRVECMMCSFVDAETAVYKSVRHYNDADP